MGDWMDVAIRPSESESKFGKGLHVVREYNARTRQVECDCGGWTGVDALFGQHRLSKGFKTVKAGVKFDAEVED